MSAPVEIVKYGGFVVRCVQRGDGRWHLRWRVGGKERSTTARDRGKALARAREIARELSGQVGTEAVSREEAMAVRLIRDLAGREGLSVLGWLGRAEAVLAAAGGSWAGVDRAVRHWEASGIGKIERVPMVLAIERCLSVYRDSRARHTLAGVRKELDAWVRAGYGAMGCWEVSREVMEAFIGRAREDGMEPAARYFNNRLGTWRAFWSRCVEWGYWPAGEPSPAEGIGKRREVDRAPEILSPEQAWAGLGVLEARGPDLVWYWVLGCWAGLRPMELSRLRWEDLLWERRSIAVRAEVAGKTGRERFVPMEGPVLALRDRPRPRRKAGPGKVCGYKDPVRIAGLLREAGVLSSWAQDVMRHSYISYRIARGDSLARIAEEAGNSEGIIRRRYRRPLMGWEGSVYFDGEKI